MQSDAVQSFPTAGQAAFATVLTLAVVTGGSAILAATVTSKVAAVAYGIFALTGAGASIASMTAYGEPDSTSAGAYFRNFKNHAGVAIAGIYQMAAQAFTQALIQGVADGIGKKVSRSIGGADVTYSRV